MPFDARDTWNRLADDYERSRLREDSLDMLVEYPAQLAVIGGVAGIRILDVGCGSGAKAEHLASVGAAEVVALDISDVFIDAASAREHPSHLTFVRGDINALDGVDALAGRRFDLILCLAVFGFAHDRTAVLRSMRRMLSPNGRIVLQTPSPIRFAVEKAERFGLPLGAAYRSHPLYAYRSGWNPQVMLEHRTPTVSEMLNAVADAGLRVARCVEPEMTEEARARYPKKAEWWDHYGGVLLYELVPIP